MALWDITDMNKAKFWTAARIISECFFFHSWSYYLILDFYFFFAIFYTCYLRVYTNIFDSWIVETSLVECISYQIDRSNIHLRVNVIHPLSIK